MFIKKMVAVLALSFPVLAFAQSKFVPGYVVTNQGDTLKGSVDYQFGKSKECHFLQTGSNDKKQFTVNDIKGYGILKGKTFVVKKLPVDSAKSELGFAELIVQGKASLYRYDQFFYIEKDSIYRLYTTSKQVLDKSVNYELYYEQTTKKYVGILNYLFSDCEGISSEVTKVRLQEGDLTKLTSRYNKCVGSENKIYKEKLKATKINVVAYTGVTFSKITFGSTYDLLISGDMADAQTTSPTIGVGFHFSNQKEDSRVSGTLDLQLSKDNFSGSASRQESIYIYKDQYEFSYTRLGIPIGVKYIFKNGKFRPYGRLGYVFNVWFNGHTTGTHDLYSSSTGELITSQKRDTDITGIKIGQLWACAGSEIGLTRGIKAFVEARADFLGGHGSESVHPEADPGAIIMDPKSITITSYSLFIGVKF